MKLCIKKVIKIPVCIPQIDSIFNFQGLFFFWTMLLLSSCLVFLVELFMGNVWGISKYKKKGVDLHRFDDTGKDKTEIDSIKFITIREIYKETSV